MRDEQLQHPRHHSPVKVHDTGSTCDPSPRIDPYAEIVRYLDMVKEKPQTGNVTHRTLTAGQRRLAGTRELAGGRAQSWR